METLITFSNILVSFHTYQAGIQPHATLVHDDLPQALDDEYGGWLSRNVVYGSRLQLASASLIFDTPGTYFGNEINHLFVGAGKTSLYMLMCALEILAIGFYIGRPLTRPTYLFWVVMMWEQRPHVDARPHLELIVLRVTPHRSPTLLLTISCWHTHQLQICTRTSTR